MLSFARLLLQTKSKYLLSSLSLSSFFYVFWISSRRLKILSLSYEFLFLMSLSLFSNSFFFSCLVLRLVKVVWCSAYTFCINSYVPLGVLFCSSKNYRLSLVVSATIDVKPSAAEVITSVSLRSIAPSKVDPIGSRSDWNIDYCFEFFSPSLFLSFSIF